MTVVVGNRSGAVIERREKGPRGCLHSAQFGDDAIVEVICLFSAFKLGFSTSSRINSCLLLGGSVNITGIFPSDMVASVRDCGQVCCRCSRYTAAEDVGFCVCAKAGMSET